jgi:hypothetical protein
VVGSTPAYLSGKYSIHSGVNIHGRSLSAIELKDGAVRWPSSSQARLQVLMHPYSGEVALIRNGEICWVDLKDPMGTRIVELEIDPAPASLNVCAAPLWPRPQVGVQGEQTIVSLALSIIQGLKGRDQVGIDFEPPSKSSSRGDLPLWDLMRLPPTQFRSAVQLIAAALLKAGLNAKLVLRLAAKDLERLPDLLWALRPLGASGPTRTIIVLQVDQSCFLKATVSGFEGLAAACAAAKSELMFDVSFETANRFLGDFLRCAGLKVSLVNDGDWPATPIELWHGGPPRDRVAIYCADGVTHNAAHMLIAMTLVNWPGACHVDLWNGPEVAIDLAPLLPKVVITWVDGSPTVDELRRYKVLVSSYPDEAPLEVIRRCAEAATPFLFGSASDLTLNREPLRSLASCRYWEDSADIAMQIAKLVGDRRGFGEAYLEALSGSCPQ